MELISARYLLPFFFRYMKDIISKGNSNIAQPPLFSIKVGKDYITLQRRAEGADTVKDS
jgi:DNA gyrase/topoisomerase IV subunit B